LNLEKTSLVSYVKTRWNSLYEMANRAIELKQAMILYFCEYKPENPLNDDDWKLLEEIIDILRPMYLVTIELSAEKTTTLAKVVPIVKILLDKYAIEIDENDEIEVIKTFQQLIYEGIKKRFKDIEDDPLFTNATILDPRFKNLVFSSKDKAQQAETKVNAEAYSKGIATNTNLEETKDEPQNELASSSQNEHFDEFWSTFDSQPLHQKPKRSRASDPIKKSIENELKIYLSLPRIERKSCPIMWWKTNGNRFPFLFEAAKKYQCMPATSVPSERVFSKAGNVITKKRTRLGKRTANMIITLNTNLK